MRNSLPCVSPARRIGSRLRVGLAIAGFLGAMTSIMVVGTRDSHAAPGGAASRAPSRRVPSDDPRLAALTMPGAKFRQRDPLVLDSVAAVGYLLGTENIDDPAYRRLRRAVSDEVAARMKLDPVALDRAWSRVTRDHQIAILAAVSQLGVPYVEGKEDPHVRMDCSGLLWYAWRVAGVDAPRVSVAQIDPRLRIPQREAKAGDIAGEGKHVHLYLGLPKAFIHAPYSGRRVRLKIMSDAQWARVAWTDPSNIANYRL